MYPIFVLNQKQLANVEGMYEFWEDMNKLYGESDKLKIYSSMLFRVRNDGSCVDLYKRYLELKDEAISNGMKFLKGKGAEYKMKTNYCMADSDGRCVVISPDGELFYFEHLPTNTACSNISDENFKLKSDPRALLEAIDKCRNCPFLPECTPFICNGCPDRCDYCREFKAVDTDAQLSKLS